MASIREQIIQAVVAALDGSGKPAGLTVHRYRTRPLEKDDLPAQVVYPAGTGGAVAETVRLYGGTNDVLRELRVRIESRVMGAQPDQLLDPLYIWAVKAVMSDPTLGGLAHEIREEATSFDAVEFEQPVGASATDIIVEYVTSQDDPEIQR